jgi:hypothetical protein
LSIVIGEFQEGHIGLSGKAPFFCIAKATEEKLAEVQWNQNVTRWFSIKL